MTIQFVINNKKMKRIWELDIIPRKGDLIFSEDVVDDEISITDIGDVMLVEKVIWMNALNGKPIVEIHLINEN